MAWTQQSELPIASPRQYAAPPSCNGNRHSFILENIDVIQQIVHETKQVQVETLETLRLQGQQMKKIAGALEDVSKLLALNEWFTPHLLTSLSLNQPLDRACFGGHSMSGPSY